MPISLEQRKFLIEKMDKQFASDLETRRKSNIVRKQANGNFLTSDFKAAKKISKIIDDNFAVACLSLELSYHH